MPASQENRSDVSSQGCGDTGGSLSAANLKASEVLERAAALIEPEGAWVQHALARLGDKLFADASSEGWREASCFCASGAVGAVIGSDRFSDLWGRSIGYVEALVNDCVPFWNDAPGRTQAEVVQALRQAAELAREEGQ